MAHLRLAEMRAQRDGTFTHFRSAIKDRRGQSHYELSVHGTRKLVDSVFGKSGLDVDIDPDATEQDAAKRAHQILEPYYEKLSAAATEPWRIAPQRARKPIAPTPSKNITVSLRRKAGEGTFWMIATPLPVAWPAGVTLTFALPRCFTGGAMAVPLSGNPNVFIRFNSPFAPIAAAAVGLGVDVATFANAPWFHVNSFNQFPAVGGRPAVAQLSCWGFGLLPF